MPEIFKKNIKRATRNVISHGDTDVFPFSYENIIIRRNEEKFVDCVFEISENFETYITEYPPQFENVLAPVGYTGYRWVTQIDPFWNAYLLSSIIRHAKAAEDSRIDVKTGVIHSYRYLHKEESDSLFKKEYNWRSFMIKSYEHAKKNEFVITTDISEFYRRIYHHRIENSLGRIAKGNIPNKVDKILNIYSGGTSYGMPIGGPASRMIAESVLNQIDHLLIARNIEFCRFVDDYHIFAQSEEDAYKALQILSELLILNQGLSLQKSKTRVLSAGEFVSTFPTHLLPEAQPSNDGERLFSINLNYDPYSPNADDDYEALKESLGKIDFLALLNEELAKSQVHGPTVTRLIKSLRVTAGLTRLQAIKTLMSNIGILYPVLSDLLIVLRGIKDDLTDEEYGIVCEKLIDLISQNSYLLSLDIHKCFATRVLYGFHDYRVDAIFTKWLTDGCPALKRDVLIAFAARGGWNHISDFKNRIAGQTPWVRRAMLAVSYGLGDEGTHWRQAQKQTPFEKFVTDSLSTGQAVDYSELI